MTTLRASTYQTSGHEGTGPLSVTLPALLPQNAQEPKTLTENPAAATCRSSPAPPPTPHPPLGLEHLQSEGRFLLQSPGRGGPPGTSEWKVRPWARPGGTLPPAEEARGPILPPPTACGSSGRGSPRYTPTGRSTSVCGRIQCDLLLLRNNNNKRCSGVISTTFSVSKAIINGFLFYSPKRRKGLRSSHWLLPPAFPSQLHFPRGWGHARWRR